MKHRVMRRFFLVLRYFNGQMLVEVQISNIFVADVKKVLC